MDSRQEAALVFSVAAAAAILAALGTVRAEVLFRDVTAEAGLSGVGAVNMSWADYDNDGWPDLLVGCSRLFRNDGPPDFTFTEVTSQAGLNGDHGTWADLDNDGDLDLYCAGQGESARLWRNNGDGTFTEITDFDGDGVRDMTVNSPSLAGAWADYDLDGFVDMYVGNYERDLAVCDVDTLWKNDGDSTFTDVTTPAGIYAGESSLPNADPGMCARGVTWGDYNNDGWPDIYVSDYRLDPNMLFENRGDGTFVEVAGARGVDGHPDGTSWGHSLGSEFFDMDNDADLDLYTSNLAHWWGTAGFGHDISYLWRNEGAAGGFGFTDVRAQSGMRPYTPNPFDPTNDFEEAGPGWADFDNDTIPDLYVPRFYPFRQNWGTLYRGTGVVAGVAQFQDVSDPGNGDCGSEPNPANFTVGPTCLKRWYSWNAVWADYDRDGDLDLAVTGNNRFYECTSTSIEGCQSANPSNRDTWPQPSFLWLFRNETGNANHWLEIRLVGQVGNRAAIGARVTVVVGGIEMMREVSGGHGYHSAQSDLPVEFGLGAATVADAVRVRWPSPGFPVSTFSGVAADERLVLYETGAAVRRGGSPQGIPPYATAQRFPWTDPEPVLDPALHGSYFYSVEDDTADIRLDKDLAAGSVRISIWN